MRGRRILGIVVVMAMVVTAMPLLTGNAKAANSTEHVPSYLVIVRDIPEPHYVRTIDKTIGNAYQDDKFGVEVIAHGDDYTYRPNNTDLVSLEITGIGVKGSDAGDYKVEWLEIGSTKFSFEGKGSTKTPHATDYTSSVQAVSEDYVGVGLRGEVHHQEVEWFKEISGAVAGTATSLAMDAVTDGAAGPLSGLVGSGASYLVENAIDSMFNINQDGIDYKGSDPNPWSPTATYPHTFTLLRGVTDGSSDNPNKVLLSRTLQWNLFDGVNDRVHILTLKATLCYAKYGPHPVLIGGIPVIVRGWYDEHKISTSVSIYVAPQKYVNTIMTRSGETNITLDKSLSDPADPWSYSLEVINHISWSEPHYSVHMPVEGTGLTPRGDTNPSHKVDLLVGNDEDDDLLNATEHYYYYQGTLTQNDTEDCYHVDYVINIRNYDSNIMHLWIFATDDIVVYLNFYGTWSTIYIKGGTSWDLNKEYVGDGSDRWADIEIFKANNVEDASYVISAYVRYEGYGDGPDGPPNSGSGGCPFLYTYSTNGWKSENNILVWAENATRPSLDTEDYYLFNGTENNGNITIGIGEPGEDVDFIDSVKLYRVNAPDGYNVTESYRGRVYAYKNVESGIAMDNHGRNVTSLINKEDGNYWLGDKGDYVDIFLNLSRKNLLVIRGIDNPPEEASRNSVLYRPPTTMSTIWVYANISDEWVKLGEIKVRHNLHENVVNLNYLIHKHKGNVELRFVMRDRNGIDFIGISHNFRRAHLKMVKLEDSSYGYEKIKSKDGNYLRLNPGDFVRMNFKSRGNRLYLLKVNGFYFNREKIGRGIGIVKENETNIAEAKLQTNITSGVKYVLLPLPENYSEIRYIIWFVDGIPVWGEKPVVSFSTGEHEIELKILRSCGEWEIYNLQISVY